MNLTPEVILAFVTSGIGSSLLTEGASWLNKKLVGTPLSGLGAFAISGAIAFIVGSFQVVATGISTPQNLSDILTLTGAIWIASQTFFQIIIKKVNALHVTPSPDYSDFH